MAVETVLQHWILTSFVYPFLLVFFIVFAVLEKSKVFGEGKMQLNAMVAFVSLIVVFVFLLLWGFIVGEGIKVDASNKIVKYASAGLIFIAVAVAVLWATGIWDEIYGFLFKQTWSKELWTNVIFVLVIVGALAAVLKTTKSKS